MRGHASTGMTTTAGDVHALLEHSNRGKRSLGVDLTSREGCEILYQLAATSDVFLTNKLAGVRAKLGIELEQMREANPNIIYASGTGQGERGPDASKGSYDVLAFWARAGVALGVMRPEYELLPMPPGPGFGDSIGAMTIAGGIMGALFYRERTGKATTVDISLLGTGLWAMGQSVALSLLMNQTLQPLPKGRTSRNPLVVSYQTRDDRHIMLCCLQAGEYWAPLCDVIGRPELAADERFKDHESLLAHTQDAVAILEEVFLEGTLDEWRKRLKPFAGQWSVVQTVTEAALDPQSVANGYIQDCETAAGVPFQMVAVPVQYDRQSAPAGRAPEFNEHGDAILAELGLEWDTVIDLKVRGVVA
jgi:crotonobetainyl-CoA:carnitine CoA-transferase CaiB-like acyl-CoA transferase